MRARKTNDSLMSERFFNPQWGHIHALMPICPTTVVSRSPHAFRPGQFTLLLCKANCRSLSILGHPTIGTAWYCGNLDAQQQQQQQEQEFTLQLLAGPVTASCDTVTATAAALIPHNVHIHKHPVTAEAVWRSQPSLEAFVLRNQDAKATKEAEEKPQQQYPLRADFPVVSIVKGMTFILVELPTVQDHLGRVQAGAGAIEGVQLDENWESVITSPYFYVILPSSDSKITKIRTRMVEARIGEDAATGSAASSLCTYLSLQRGEAGASYAFEIEQGVEMGRRSVIRVTVVLDNTGQAIERVRLGGSAVVTMQGVLTA